MASVTAKGKRKFLVMKRLEDVVTRLSADYGIESRAAEKVVRDGAGKVIADRDLAEIVRLEFFADLFETLEASFKSYDFRQKINRLRQK